MYLESLLTVQTAPSSKFMILSRVYPSGNDCFTQSGMSSVYSVNGMLPYWDCGDKISQANGRGPPLVTVSFTVCSPLEKNELALQTRHILQGAPKVRSSNFMHYNFWSKLYFYMKFLEDVYFSIKYMCSQSSVTGNPFLFFLSYSVAVAASRGIQRVDPQMTHFELFYHLVRRVQFNPQTIFV